MVGRPYWCGQMKVSLVSFGIQHDPAMNSRAGVTFHRIDRETGKRVHHRNVVNRDEPVENAEIVKGTSTRKGSTWWSSRVKTVSTFPPPGLFAKDAETIARSLASKNYHQKGPALECACRPFSSIARKEFERGSQRRTGEGQGSAFGTRSRCASTPRETNGLTLRCDRDGLVKSGVPGPFGWPLSNQRILLGIFADR